MDLTSFKIAFKEEIKIPVQTQILSVCNEIFKF